MHREGLKGLMVNSHLVFYRDVSRKGIATCFDLEHMILFFYSVNGLFDFHACIYFEVNIFTAVTTIIVLNLFHWMIKSLLLEMNCVF